MARVLIVEIKICPDTKHRDQLQNARDQHAGWVEALKREGYAAANIRVVPILLGISGTIYNKHTMSALDKLGLDRTRAQACAKKLHTLMVQQLHSIVKNRRRLQHSTQPTT